MSNTINLNAAYIPSENVVAREIEGELIIVPITSGVGDMEDELYTLNDTGKVIWNRIKRTCTVKHLIAELTDEYDAPPREIETDVIGLLSELLTRKMIVATPVDANSSE